MRLTLQCDYALRTLMLAAVRKQDCTIPAVAEHYGISRNHLIVVVHNLGKSGFLKNTRGRGGGLALARPASEVTLGSVVRAFEPLDIVECFRPETNTCLITGPCRLQNVLGRAMAAWLQVLDSTTLADLVDDNQGLIHLLQLANPGNKSPALFRLQDADIP